MPDPIRMLEADHRRVEQLFGEFQRSRNAEIAREICTELKVHTAIEDQVIYPVLRGDVPGGAPLEHHAEEEHRRVERFVAQIEQAGYQGLTVEVAMQQVIGVVKDHVEEEEGDAFPKLRDALGEERLDRLGWQLEEAKRRAMAAMASSAMAAASMGTPAPGGTDGHEGLDELTKDQLYEQAQVRGIVGRSKMTKRELVKALQKNT